MNPNAEPDNVWSIESLLPQVYAELRALAASYLAGERGHTLQPTALVHEAYLKMANGDRRWAGRDHFFAVAATAMRHVLVDHARRRNADKRGGGAVHTCITSAEAFGDAPGPTRELKVLELDELLSLLARADARAAQTAELHLFGGMDHEQVARVLGVSRGVAAADWHFARAWLASKVSGVEA